MDIEGYSRILSYVVCELTMPVKRHAYNFLANDQSSLNHHLLSAAGKAVFPQNQNITVSQNKFDTTLEESYLFSDSFPESAIGEYLLEDSIEDTSKTKFLGKRADNISAMSISSNQERVSQMLDQYKLEQPDSKINTDPNSISELNGTAEEMLEEIEIIEDSDRDCEVVAEISNDQMSGFDSDSFLQTTSETDFKNMFKITRSTFENLLEFLSKEEMEPIEDISLQKKVLIVLWLMGNSGSYSEAAELFTVSEEAAANCFFDVCATLYNQSDNIITWPDFEECNELATRIENNYGFPGVVGILGCRYISISIPKEALSRREHFNAKLKTYCIALQIVCDDNLVIRDIFPGLPGGLTEAQVFRKSPISELLTSQTQPNQLIEPHKHILARSIYPQLTTMLTPYSEAADTLSEEEVELNELHENVCQLVDQTFDMLQDRFATLKILDPEVATMVLVVACVLHNFSVVNGDLFGIET